MVARNCSLLLALVATACHAPRSLELGPLPEGVQTLLLVAFDPDDVVAVLVPAEDQAHLALEGVFVEELFILGFRTPIASMGEAYARGRLELPGPDDPGRPLPTTVSAWHIDARGVRAVDFFELPEQARALRLPRVDLFACLEAQRCFPEGDLERFCTGCPIQDPPIAPAPAAPPSVAPCHLGTADERFDCLFGLAAVPDRPCTGGLDVPSGCVAEAPCGYGDDPPPEPVVYVLGASPDPGDVVVEPDLASALRRAGPTGRVRLGAGAFHGDVGFAIESTIEGLCPAHTELVGPASFGSTATVARLTLGGASWVAAGHRLALEGIQVPGPMVVVGALYARRTAFGADLDVQGIAKVETATFAGGLTVRDGAFGDLDDVRFGPGASVSVRSGGEARISDGWFAGGGEDRPIDIDRDGRFIGERLMVFGEIKVNTEGSEAFSLTDVAITVRDRAQEAGIIARTDVHQGESRERQCESHSDGKVTLHRVLARSSDALTEPIQNVESAIVANCTTIDFADVTVDGMAESVAVSLQQAPGTAHRLLLTNYRVLDAADLGRAPAEPPDFPGGGLSINLPYDDPGEGEIFELRDVTVLARGGGVRLGGLATVDLDRLSVQGGQRRGLAIDELRGQGQIANVRCSHMAAPRKHGGFGIEIVGNGDAIGDVAIRDFWVEGNESAGLHFEGDLRAVQLLRGEVRGNGVGLLDANSIGGVGDRLTAVRFSDNALTLSSDLP